MKSRVVIFALLSQCRLVEAWLPTAEELVEWCKLPQWEEKAASLQKEPDEDIRQWLSTPINADLSTPVHICASQGNLGLLQLLLSQEPEPHQLLERTDVAGNTPLHRAVIEGHLAVVRYLLARGAVVSVALPDGQTPLHRAAAGGYLSVVQCLLDHGAVVTETTTSGATPLHWAAANGHLSVVRYLLDYEAQAGAAASDGMTPLHLAAMNGHLSVVHCLLEHGARADAATSDGVTPQQLAEIRGHQDIVQLLDAVPSQGPLTPVLLAAILTRLGVGTLSNEP